MVWEYSVEKGIGINWDSVTLTCEVTSNAPHAPAPCVTEKVWPAMVAVPERTPPVLGATLRTTTPPPEPEAPEVTVSHGTLLTAVQGQPLAALTDTLIFPPVSPGEANGGLIEYEQLKPDSLMLYCWPPAVMNPERGVKLPLAATA